VRLLLLLLLSLLLVQITGVFNIEGGCYAKCIGLKPSSEPEIYAAIRFGSVLENVVVDESTRDVDYSSAALTENTRASYPIDYIPNARVPCVGGHPTNVILLCCDAFGCGHNACVFGSAYVVYCGIISNHKYSASVYPYVDKGCSVAGCHIGVNGCTAGWPS
jgi:Phosphoenolpyruvate carboxykinase